MPRPSPSETWRKKHYGRCRICMRPGRFTKEHVPPQSALNSGTFVISQPQESGGPGRVTSTPTSESPGGIVFFTLCELCNNKTGRQFGSDYVSFVRAIEPHAVPTNVNQDILIDFSDLHPLRIVKQVISMFLSTSKPTGFLDHEYVSAPGRSRKDLDGISIKYPTKDDQRKMYEDLRRFVKVRDAVGLPVGIRLHMFASVGRRLGFSTGIFALINLTEKRAAFAAVTGLYPVHWVVTLNCDLGENVLDVTDWGKCGYKEKFDKPVSVPMRWLESHYPLDFRSPQDLLTSNFINSMKFEGFMPTAGLDKDARLEEALHFARTLGKFTTEGYMISTFPSGTFYEFEGVNGWLEHAPAEFAIEVLKHRLVEHNPAPDDRI